MTKSNKTKNLELETKLQNWKEKAKARRLENEYLKQRIKELTQSRDNWKSKYKREQIKNKELLKASKKTISSITEDTKIKHHSYSVRVILLIIWLRSSSSISLRACCQTLSIFNLVYDLDFQPPSIGSIQSR